MSDLTDTSLAAEALFRSGFASLRGPFATAWAAFDAAAETLRAVPVDQGFRPLEVIGDFVIPPAGGPPSRDFQTLHFDFGLPLNPMSTNDVARYTALHIPQGTEPSSAVTRLVPLRALLKQVHWPDRRELLKRLLAYGETHGAWDHRQGYTEGSLARIVEAAAGGAPRLPSVSANPDFLCGNEFSSLSAELAFFAAHGLSVPGVQFELTIRPGTVAIFDNLAVAHGRHGTRRAAELNQRVFGHAALGIKGQQRLRDRALAAFSH